MWAFLYLGQVCCSVGPIASSTMRIRNTARGQPAVDRSSIQNLMAFGRDKQASASSTSPCADLRTAYHNCFNRWYSEKFLKGQWDKQECVIEWDKYRACLSQHLEDKHLSRFLDAEALFDLSQHTDSGKGEAS